MYSWNATGVECDLSWKVANSDYQLLVVVNLEDSASASTSAPHQGTAPFLPCHAHRFEHRNGMDPHRIFWLSTKTQHQIQWINKWKPINLGTTNINRCRLPSSPYGCKWFHFQERSSPKSQVRAPGLFDAEVFNRFHLRNCFYSWVNPKAYCPRSQNRVPANQTWDTGNQIWGHQPNLKCF